MPQKPEVLLVEDDDALAEAVGEILTEIAPVAYEKAATQAVDRIQGGNFGLVVSDLHLEGERFSGRRVIEAARKRGIPVMLCSASTREEVKEALGDLFPDAMVLKPFSIDELLNEARRLFRSDSQSN